MESHELKIIISQESKYFKPRWFLKKVTNDDANDYVDEIWHLSRSHYELSWPLVKHDKV